VIHLDKKESDQKKRAVIDHSKKPNTSEKKKDEKETEEFKLADLCKHLNKKVEDDKPDKLSQLKNQYVDQYKVNIEKKDIKDYYNAHKMMVELYKINNDEEDSVKDLNIEELKKNIDLKQQSSDNYLGNQRYDDESMTSEKSSDLGDTDHSKFEEMRSSLEQQLGGKLFSHAYKIVDDTIPEDSFTYDHEKISMAFIKLKGYDKDKILLCIEKIPELYSLVIKEKESQYKKKK